MSKIGHNSNQGVGRKTYDEFLAELKSFHSSNKTPFYREPYLLGRKMDLLKLYNVVLSRGGFKKVTDEKSWSLIVEDLRLGRRCVNAPLAIKQLYQRYLETYERYHTHDEDGWPGGNVVTSTSGVDNEVEGDSDAASSARLRCGRYAPAPSECAVPMVYNENAHMIPPHMRQKWGMSTKLTELKEYSILEKSLHSGLPNEVDFSLNATLLMSSQPSGLNLTLNNELVNLLLAHVGVFDEGTGSYLPVEPYWRQQDDRNMLRYWYENIQEPEARIYLLPEIFSQPNVNCDEAKFLEKIESARRQLPLSVIYDLFNLRDDLTLPDTEGHRVFVVATALRNLALDEKCTRVLASHPQVLRFALLCGHARHAALRQLGQEMLALLRFPIEGTLARHFSRLLLQCVDNIDRTTRLRGLEMVARQCQLVDNKQFLSNELPVEVYDAIISNLLVKDLHLVVNALEAMYMLSTIGTDACERLITNEHCIPLLMSLLTIEAQAMGTDGLIRVKIMQGTNQTTVCSQAPVLIGHQSSQNQSGTGNIGLRLMPGQSLMPPPNSLPRSGTTVVAASAVSMHSNRHGATVGSSRSHGRSASPQVIQQQQAAGGQSSYVPIAPKPLLAAQSSINSARNVQPNSSVSSQQCTSKSQQIPSSTPVLQSPQSMSNSNSRKSSQGGVRGSYMTATDQSSHSHIVIRQYDHDPDAPTERREFTLYWLRKYYEPYSQASVSRVHIYTEFQRAYSKQFQQLTNVTALEFHSCVKQAFPNVGQVKVQVPAGNVEIHYNHIKHVDDSPPSLQLPLSVTSSGTNLTLPQIVSKTGANATKSISYVPTQQHKVAATGPVVELQQSSPLKHLSQKQPEKHVQYSSHSSHVNIIQTVPDAAINQKPLIAEQKQTQSVQHNCHHHHHHHHHQFVPSFTIQNQPAFPNSSESQDGNIVTKKDNQVRLVVHKTANQLVTASVSALPVNTAQYSDGMNEIDKLDHPQQIICSSMPTECDTNVNGSQCEAPKDDRISASPSHSCKSPDSRKRPQPSPPMAPISPISSPAPKRSRPNSVTSCTASSSSNLTDDCLDNSINPHALIARVPESLKQEKEVNLFDRDNAETMVNGDNKGPSILSETPATSMDSLVDDKTNGSLGTSSGDETVVRRVFNGTILSTENISSNDDKHDAKLVLNQRQNRLINGASNTTHVNGLVRGTVTALASISDRAPNVVDARIKTTDSLINQTPSVTIISHDSRTHTKRHCSTIENSEDVKPNLSLHGSDVSLSGTGRSSDNHLSNEVDAADLQSVKTVNFPTQAVVVTSSHCNHVKSMDSNGTYSGKETDASNSSQVCHGSSLITTSNILHKQHCVHNHISHQRSCIHHPNQQTNSQAQQTHQCTHAHAHQHHQKGTQNQLWYPNHNHQNQHLKVAKSVMVPQHHVCCVHSHQQQQALTKSPSGTDSETSSSVNGIVRVPVISDSSTSVAGLTEPATAVSISSTVLPSSSPTSIVSQSSLPGSQTTPKPVKSAAKSKRTPSRKMVLTCPSGYNTSMSSDSSNNLQQNAQPPGVPVSSSTSSTIVMGHICEWEGCSQVFENSSALQKHVFSEHVPTSASPNQPSNRRYECQWVNCERIPRGLYSLQGHVQEVHLSPTAQQLTQIQRQNNNQNSRNSQNNTVRTVASTIPSSSGILNPNENLTRSLHQATSVSLYPIDAAMQAIRRHAVVPDLLTTESVQCTTNISAVNSTYNGAVPVNSALREGPVTKHLRLTAALTIRNLVTYSDKARACLRHEESHLAQLALSTMESSKTICQFLYLLKNADET